MEDLREPIIKDNLLDDEILQGNLDKNRLDQWFKAACRAGKNAYLREKNDMWRSSSAGAESGVEELDAEASIAESDAVVETSQDQDLKMQEL